MNKSVMIWLIDIDIEDIFIVNNGARWIFTSYNFVFRYLAWFYLVVFILANQLSTGGFNIGIFNLIPELLVISYLLMKNKNE